MSKNKTMKDKLIQIYGKGIHGRHNDNTYEIVRWYTSQLKKILRDDYNRKTE